jgi:MFS family permease
MLACLSLRSLTSIVMIPFAGHMSDLYGRKKIVAIGLVGIGLFSLVFPDAGDEGVSLVFLAMVIDSVLQDL